MSYIVLRQNRGHWYKYQVESIWQDGQTKKRQTYLGRATPEEIEAWCRVRGLGPGIQQPKGGIRIPRGGEKRLRNDSGAFQAQKKPPPEQEREAWEDQAREPVGEVSQVGEAKPTNKEKQSRAPRLYVMNTQRKPHLDFLREWALPRFEEKFGQPANTVFCHPGDLAEIAPDGLGVRLVARGYVQPNCFQLARESESHE